MVPAPTSLVLEKGLNLAAMVSGSDPGIGYWAKIDSLTCYPQNLSSGQASTAMKGLSWTFNHPLR